MAVQVAVDRGAEQGQVRLGLGPLAQSHGVLDLYDRPIISGEAQQPVQPVDTDRVPAAHGGHLDDLPVKKLGAALPD